MPDDRAKYTIECDADGRLAARVDFKSRTRNLNIHERWSDHTRSAGADARAVPTWFVARSDRQTVGRYPLVIKAGHLILSLMADGGIYEFEPARKTE